MVGNVEDPPANDRARELTSAELAIATNTIWRGRTASYTGLFAVSERTANVSILEADLPTLDATMMT